MKRAMASLALAAVCFLTAMAAACDNEPDWTVVHKEVVQPPQLGDTRIQGVFRVVVLLDGSEHSLDYAAWEEPPCYTAARLGQRLPAFVGASNIECR